MKLLLMKTIYIYLTQLLYYWQSNSRQCISVILFDIITYLTYSKTIGAI